MALLCFTFGPIKLGIVALYFRIRAHTSYLKGSFRLVLFQMRLMVVEVGESLFSPRFENYSVKTAFFTLPFFPFFFIPIFEKLQWWVETLFETLEFLLTSYACLSMTAPEFVSSVKENQKKLALALLEKAKEICASRGVYPLSFIPFLTKLYSIR
jgi:hypothetical protein